MPSTVPLQPTNLYRSDDGSLHPVIQRFVIETRHNTDRYAIPDNVGLITRVQLYAEEMRPFEFLECPSSANYIRVFANGQAPHSPEEARALLQKIRAKVGNKLWLRYDGHLYLYPAPVNSGERLIVDYEAK